MSTTSDIRIDDGFATIISFANNPTVKFYEKEVTPPGMDGGGANDTTTMRNSLLRTKAPKKLKTMTDITAIVSYASRVFQLDQVWAMINLKQVVTVTFPDGATIAFWGWLDKFAPASNKEGEQPTATVTVICSNEDDEGVEQAPVYTEAA